MPSVNVPAQSPTRLWHVEIRRNVITGAIPATPAQATSRSGSGGGVLHKPWPARHRGARCNMLSILTTISHL